jgi:hypothetical protein
MEIATDYAFSVPAGASTQQRFTPAGAFYTVTDLRQRGWTRRLIQRFLGNADSLAPNPHIKRGRPMKYFETARVHSVEAREIFEEETQASLQRKQAGQKVLEEKTQALVELAKTVDPDLPDWSIADLDEKAFELFGMISEGVSLHRAHISALVQFCSSSEWVLDDYFWHPGIRPARIVIRRKVLAKIIQTYPHLNDVALEWAKKEKGNAQIDIFLA